MADNEPDSIEAQIAASQAVNPFELESTATLTQLPESEANAHINNVMEEINANIHFDPVSQVKEKASFEEIKEAIRSLKNIHPDVADVAVDNKAINQHLELLEGDLETNRSELKNALINGTLTEKEINGIAVRVLIDDKGGEFIKATEDIKKSSDIIKDIEANTKDFKDLEFGAGFTTGKDPKQAAEEQESVKIEQRKLEELGYDIDGDKNFGADGKIGKVTTAAVKKFQKDHDLDATGIINEETSKKMTEEVNKSRDRANAIDDPYPIKPLPFKHDEQQPEAEPPFKPAEEQIIHPAFEQKPMDDGIGGHGILAQIDSGSLAALEGIRQGNSSIMQSQGDFGIGDVTMAQTAVNKEQNKEAIRGA